MRPRDGARSLSLAAGILLVAAGLLHVSAAADHDEPIMTGGFLVVAYLQVGLGVLLVARRPSRGVMAAGVVMTVACVGLWLMSRTLGLTFIPGGHAEPVGLKDGACVLFELASLPLLVVLASGRLAGQRVGNGALALIAAVTLAMLVPGLAAPGHQHPLGALHPHALALGHAATHGLGIDFRLTGTGHGHAGSRRAHARHARHARHGGTSHAQGGSNHRGHLVAAVHSHGGHQHVAVGGAPAHRHPAGHVRRHAGGGHRHVGRHAPEHRQHAGTGHQGHPPSANPADHHHHDPPPPESPVDSLTRQVTDLVPGRR